MRPMRAFSDSPPADLERVGADRSFEAPPSIVGVVLDDQGAAVAHDDVAEQIQIQGIGHHDVARDAVAVVFDVDTDAHHVPGLRAGDDRTAEGVFEDLGRAGAEKKVHFPQRYQ